MPKVFILPLYSKIPCGQDGYGGAAWKSVRDILAEKHPPGQDTVSDFVPESNSVDAPCYVPVLFEQLTGDLIRWALFVLMVLLVLLVWMLTLGDDCVPLLVQPLILCNGLAAVAYCLCVDDVDSAELMAFAACRLIPLD